jgi:hypothetical protein
MSGGSGFGSFSPGLPKAGSVISFTIPIRWAETERALVTGSDLNTETASQR